MLVYGENIPTKYGNNYIQYYGVKFVIYIVFTIIMNTLLLNLLIAIISDAFEKVQSM